MHLRPGGAEVIDVHTHLGLRRGRDDARPGGAGGDARCGRRRAGGRVPAARPGARSRPTGCPTTACLQWASDSDGRLIPFCRLDPLQEPVAEAERCLAAGARGIKLHPRAQAFALVGLCEPIFALAEQAGVPILIHAGRGLPEAFGRPSWSSWPTSIPGAPLIMAHVGVADQGVLARRAARPPVRGVRQLVDNMIDTLALFARVPAERIVFGSDPPYGRTFWVCTCCCARRRVSGSRPCPAAHAGRRGAAADRRRGAAAGHRSAGTAAAAGRRAADPAAHGPDAGVRLRGRRRAGAGDAGSGAADLPRPRSGPAGAAFDRIAPLLDTAKQILVFEPEFPRRALLPIVVAMAIAATEVSQVPALP